MQFYADAVHLSCCVAKMSVSRADAPAAKLKTQYTGYRNEDRGDLASRPKAATLIP